MNFLHRLVGSRSTKTWGLFSELSDWFESKGTNYGRIFSNEAFFNQVAEKRIVFCGEIHGIPQIIALQQTLQEKLKESTQATLNVVLEHFSFEMQNLLDEYQAGKVTFEDFVKAYHEIGTEGHDIEQYRTLLEHARNNNPRIKLHAGFIPRTYARMLVREGEQKAIEEAKSKNYLPKDLNDIETSDLHYNIFESMITGRNMYDGKVPPNERFRTIFKAQIMKDISTAHCINRLIQNGSNEEKYLVIAGNGHLMHYKGVPERVLAQNPGLVPDTSLIISLPVNMKLDDIQDHDLLELLRQMFGEEGTNPADYLFLYEWEIPDVEQQPQQETHHA